METRGALPLDAMSDQPGGDQPALRARIADAADAEFRSHGFHLTTMDAIARRAGCSKKTIYKFFGSKDDLFLLVQDKVGAAFQLLEIDRSLAPPEALGAFLRQVAALLLHEDAIAAMRMALAEYTHSPTLLQAAERRGNARVRLALELYLEELEGLGEYRFGDTAEASRLLLGMAIGAFHHELLLGFVAHFPAEVVEARLLRTVEIFLGGCRRR